MISISLFVLLLILIIWANNYTAGKMIGQRNEVWNYQRTVDLSDILFDTTGQPADWNMTNVNSLGLSNSYVPDSLDYNKLTYTKNVYNSNKTGLLSLMGLKNDEDVFIRIGNMTIGNDSITRTTDKEYDIIKIVRMKKINGSIIQCELYTKMRR